MIVSEHEIQVAIAINVGVGTTGLEFEATVDRVDPPARISALIPNYARRGSAAGDHDVVQAVLVDVEHPASRLLFRLSGGRQIAGLAG